MKNLLKIGSLTVLTILITGCSTTDPQPPKPKIDRSMPTPKIVDFLSDTTAIAFEWEAIKDPQIEGFYVYRSEGEANLKRVATIKNPYSTHFLDTNLKPKTKYTYRFSTSKKDEYESVASNSVYPVTRDLIEPISIIKAITDLPRTAKIIFSPHANTIVSGYEIHRKAQNEIEFSKIATLDGRLNAEYIDTDLKDGFTYEYKIIGYTFDGLKTHPSAIVTNTTKTLPPIVEYVKASNNEPKQITITWKKVEINEEIKNINDPKRVVTYRVYRSNKIDGKYHLIAKNIQDTTYTDKLKNDGELYFYKVSAIDQYELESEFSDNIVSGNTLQKPKTPVVNYASLEDNKIVIKWEAGDVRNKTFIIEIKEKSGLFDTKVYKTTPFMDTQFIDDKIKPGNSYTYKIYAIDSNKIESLPTEEISIIFERKGK